jgi:hypothetical protein
MASTFGAAFDKLDQEVKRGVLKALQHRRRRYLKAMSGQGVNTEVILFGDTPGPARPTDPSYHHTPFYSTKNSSLWINRLLWEHGIPETSLLWFNTTLADGTKLDPSIVRRCLKNNPVLFALGGNAATWLDAAGLGYTKVFHPQAWKRFHSKKHYPLIDFLEEALDLNKVT